MGNPHYVYGNYFKKKSQEALFPPDSSWSPTGGLSVGVLLKGRVPGKSPIPATSVISDFHHLWICTEKKKKLCRLLNSLLSQRVFIKNNHVQMFNFYIPDTNINPLLSCLSNTTVFFFLFNLNLY